MTRFLLAGAATFGLMTGAAMAQMSSSQTTTTSTYPSGPVVVGNSATVGASVTRDGDMNSMSGTSARYNSGQKTTTTITNTSYPFTPMIQTTKKTVTVANGVATETTQITETYPSSTSAPIVTTTSRSYNVGMQ